MATNDIILDIETIKNANKHISSMALTGEWAEYFRHYALKPNEVYSDDPASSWNLFTHLTAFGAAKMMYEQAARINETNESTAILPKSLLNKLSVDDLPGIFGMPASTTIAFCIKETDIIENAIPKVLTSKDGVRVLVINKDMEITFESHPSFKLPYDVIIRCKPIYSVYTDPDTGEESTTVEYNIYAVYDMPYAASDGMRNVYKFYSNNISSRKIRFDGDTYIAFFLKVFQINRSVTQFYINNPNTSDKIVSFDDDLVGVEVFRRKSGTTDWILMGPGQPEGNPITAENSYNYAYDYKRNKQNFNVIFSKMNDHTSLSSGDEIKIIVYTTKGEEGNVTFPYMIYNLNRLMINYNQDLSIPNQNKMLDIVCLAFARDMEASGGSNQLTHEQIRNKIIAKKYSRNILITDTEIKNKAKEYGLDAYKTRHDVINLYYRGVDKLVYNKMTLSTGMNDFHFPLSQLKELEYSKNTYIIKPTDVFKWNKDSKYFMLNPNPDDFWKYVEKYNSAEDIEKVMEGHFPFHIQYKNTKNPSVSIYDMNVNVSDFATFTKYNEQYSLDKIDISFIRVERNPFKQGVFDIGKANPADTYFISFVVYTGENTLRKLAMQDSYINAENLDDYEKQYIKFHVYITGAGKTGTFLINPLSCKILNKDTMIKDGFIQYQTCFSTDNYVTNDKKIHIKGLKSSTNISNDFSAYSMIDTTVNIEIQGAFADCNSVGYYNRFASVFQIYDVKLVDYLSEYFDIEFDIKTDLLKYKTYQEDIPERYTEDVMKKNPNYDPTITDVMDVNHYEYAIEKDEMGDPIFVHPRYSTKYTPKFLFAFRKGDIKYYYQNPDDETDIIPETDATEEQIEKWEKYPYILHKKGDPQYFKKIGREEIVLADVTPEEGENNANYFLQPESPSYIGILKNVSWINRLYMANESLYKLIRSLYLDIVDRSKTIQNVMFDGGIFHVGLKTTSGNSRKFTAQILASDTKEYIKNIALSIEYKVKFKDNESIETKCALIRDATMEYINNIGDSNLSIDNMFEYVKNECPNIEYINLIRINSYKNGAVQTILNDASVTNEVLTVSQKVIYNEDGSISFEPDITIDVVTN